MSLGSRSSPVPPSAINELFDWWTTELRTWLGGSRRSPVATKEARPADIVVTRGAILAGETKTPFGAGQADAAIASLLQGKRGGRRKLNVQLASDRFVVRQLSGRRLPLSRAYQMAQLDIAANTPFSVDDVHVLFARGGVNQATEYVIVKRDILDPLIEAIRTHRYRLGELSFDRKVFAQPIEPYAVEFYNGETGSLFAWLRKRLFIGCLIAASCLIFWNGFAAVQSAAAAVDDRIATEEPAAAKARAAFKKQAAYVSKVQVLNREVTTYIPATRILAELTRIIPDDTYLTDFTIRDQRIQLSGFSASAARLISIIDASPLFQNPHFTTAVIKVPEGKGEQFSMELELRHAG